MDQSNLQSVVWSDELDRWSKWVYSAFWAAHSKLSFILHGWNKSDWWYSEIHTLCTVKLVGIYQTSFYVIPEAFWVYKLDVLGYVEVVSCMAVQQFIKRIFLQWQIRRGSRGSIEPPFCLFSYCWLGFFGWVWGYSIQHHTWLCGIKNVSTLFDYINWLLPSEWADQSNPVLCIWHVTSLPCIATIYCTALLWHNAPGLYALALCVNAVNFEKEIYFWDLCPITLPPFHRLLPLPLVLPFH